MAAPDRTFKSFVARKPLLTYFIFSYAFFWLSLVLFVVVVGLSGLKLNTVPSWGMNLVEIIGSWMPTVAAMVVTGVLDGRRGIKKLLLGFTQFRIGARWYLAALTPFGLAFLAAGIYLLAGGAMGGGVSLTLNFWVGLIFINLLTGPGGEELGWRGFALPRLLERYGPLKAGILLGIAWDFWHLPLWLTAGFSPLNLLVYVLSFSIAIISLSVLMTWIFCKTSNSLVPMFITHFSFNIGLNMVSTGGIGFGTPLQLLPIMAALLFIMAIVVWAAGGLSTRPSYSLNPN